MSTSAPQPTPAAAAVEDACPSIAGYQIAHRLGVGGMGTVWRATQLGTYREVALKLMSPALFGNDRARRRFEREVELTAKLQHANIARLYDSGVHQGIYFYAMELIEDGKPLDEYLARATPGTMVDIFEQVLRAVQHAHQRGVIHRDLKPANVLVDVGGVPKVLDFGLATALQDDGLLNNLTAETEVVGTPAYMSPEQAAAKNDRLDTRSDVYSLGVMLYELIVGRSPYNLTGGHWAVIQRVSEADTVRPRQARGSVDREIEAVLLKALNREPEQRYASAGEFAEDLGRYRAGEPLSARPATMQYFMRKRLWKYRRRVALVAAVLALLGGSGGYQVYQINAARRVAETARDNERDQRQIAEKRSRDAEEQRAVALGSMNDLVFAVQNQLRTVAGAARVQKSLLRIALDGLGRIDEISTDQQMLSVDRPMAAAAMLRGDLLQNDGQDAAALAAFNTSVDQFDRLYRKNTTDLAARDLMSALMRCVWLHEADEDDSAALRTALDRAAALLSELSTRGATLPPSAKWAVKLALADQAATRGEANFDALYQSAVDAVPDDSNEQITALRKWGEAAMTRADQAERAVQLLRRAVDADHRRSGGPDAPAAVAVGTCELLCHLAEAEINANDVPAAAASLDRARRVLPSTDAPPARETTLALAYVEWVSAALAEKSHDPARAEALQRSVKLLYSAGTQRPLSVRQHRLLDRATSALHSVGGPS